MNQRPVYLVGGTCALLISVGYVAIIALYAATGPPPVRSDPLLECLAANAATLWWIICLSVLTDFLFLPLTATLYFVFGSLDRYSMWLASAFIILFVVLDLAITWTNYAAALDSTEAVKWAVGCGVLLSHIDERRSCTKQPNPAHRLFS